MRENDKARFFRASDRKDVVLVLSNYDAKLKSNDHVMYEIDQEDNINDKHNIVLYHKTMNNWRVVIEGHPSINFHYIDWIGLQTNFGIHVMQIGGLKEPLADFSLCKGERIDKIYAYCNKDGLFTLSYKEGMAKKLSTADSEEE